MTAWESFCAVLAALLKALEPYVSALAAYLAGRQAQKGAEAKDALNDIAKGVDAANAIDSLSDADVLRELQRDGSLRDV